MVVERPPGSRATPHQRVSIPKQGDGPGGRPPDSCRLLPAIIHHSPTHVNLVHDQGELGRVHLLVSSRQPG